MKYRILGIVLGALTASCGDTQRATFYVEGNCSECKPLIEETLNDARGVDSAGWDFNSSTATVKFNDGRTNIDEIQQSLAAKGFETQFFPADASARKQLPACCQQPVSRQLKHIEPTLPTKKDQ